jgi:hypothetical protein
MDYSIYIKIAILVFSVFFALAAYIFWRSNKKNVSQWSFSLRLSIILGWFSILSFVGLVLAMILPPINVYEQLFLAYLPLPGLISGLFAIFMGIISYARERTRVSLWGISLGAATIVVMVVLFVTPAGGTPFFCSSNYGCSALKDGSQCTADLFFLPDSLRETSYSMHAGLCIQPLSQLRATDNGPGSGNANANAIP